MTEHPKLWRDMTAAEKGALLLAEHEGKVIQFWDKFGFEDWCDIEPSWEDDSAYRVKPEPKVETVVVTGFFNGTSGWVFGRQSVAPLDTHRLTLTIIDGEVQREAIVERIEE